LERRLQIADQFAALPSKLGLHLVFGIVQRDEFPSTFDVQGLKAGDVTALAHVVAYISCAIQVDVWLRTHAPSEVALIIVEDNDRVRATIKKMHNEYQKPNFADEMGPEVAKFLPFKKIKASPLFEQKEQSIPLQLADFCAYVLKRGLMGDGRFKRFIDPLRSRVVTFGEAHTSALAKLAET
jgi:hypothetical protein